MRVTVLFFHPFQRRSRVNRALWKAIQGVPGVVARDLYELYPEYSIDVEREQETLLGTDVLVFQHPFYWYSCPSLMKEWLDSVLEYGWAYGEGGNKLEGKRWLQAITTGGPESAYHREGYNHFSIIELMRPFEQSARRCGMVPLRPFVTHGSSVLDDAGLAAQAARYRELLAAIAAGSLPSELLTDRCEEIRG